MNFDKSRVFTCVNAEELKVGSKVILADTYGTLKNSVEDKYPHLPVCVLIKIENENYYSRFIGKPTSLEKWTKPLAYLVEETKDLKRIDLKVGDLLINKLTREEEYVISIDTRKESYYPVEISCNWLSDTDLRDWIKIS